MLFSLSKEASQKLRTENDRKLTDVFIKFAMKDGLVKQIRVCDRTQFYKLKRVVCCCVELDPDDVDGEDVDGDLDGEDLDNGDKLDSR